MADYPIILQPDDHLRTRSHLIAADTFAEEAGDGPGSVAIDRVDGDDVDWIGAFDFAPGRGPHREAAG